jgi:hypothetical protein
VWIWWVPIVVGLVVLLLLARPGRREPDPPRPAGQLAARPTGEAASEAAG